MAELTGTFSESWYRIAGQRLYLRADVRVQRQYFRGERWFVLQNPFSNQYFRLRPAAYEFVGRLRPGRTVEEVWQECVQRFPDDAPGQEAVLHLLAQLNFANLLQYEEAVDTTQLFERFKKRRQREITGRLMNLMFIRFPLLDPDRFLVAAMPIVGRLISRGGAVLWAVVVGWALKTVLDHWPEVRDQGQGVLAPGNLMLLYAGLILTKTIHEFGHAFFCRKFGGEVHVMGIMLMIFTPVPYIDASSSWGLRTRWQRALVAGAGMIAELFFAAIAVLVWVNTAPGALHSLAYNMMFVASVSTLVFNLNPLLRFDGYYILSDLLGIPNLGQRANQQLRHGWEYYVFGVKSSTSPALSGREATWLVVFGITSGIYRVIVFAGVLLVVADRFLLLGIVMALICLISWVTVPLGKFVYYLAASPRLDRVRLRAACATFGVVGGLLLLLAVIPFPNHFRAPGVLQAGERTQVINETAGTIRRVLASPGGHVSKGQPLIEMTNPELALDLDAAAARHQEAEFRLRQALSRTNADLMPLRAKLESNARQLLKLKADQELLTIRARHDGDWVAPRVQELVGRRITRGTPLGLVVNPGDFEFVATVPQTDADAAFARHPRNGEVRLHGQVGEVMFVSKWDVVAGGKQTLPSAALGWAAGGAVPVSSDEPERAKEPFFEIHAALLDNRAVAELHGRSGNIRFALEPEPLLPRWLRRLWQMLQKRYQI
jgi:putative peptide zinc metalloprotease protein